MSGLSANTVTPKIAFYVDTTSAGLAAQVQAKVNALNLALRSPALTSTGTLQTSGNTQNGSISVSDVFQVVNGNSFQYIATVHWNELVTPAA